MEPFKGLLVEGTSGVGKSTLIDALIRRHVSSCAPRKIRTLVHLAQSHTYGPLANGEDDGTLTVEANVKHLEGIAGMAEWLHASVQEHSRPWCFVVIDTLHLTHCVRPGRVRWGDVQSVDERLAGIGCKLLLLRVSPTSIWERGIEPRAQEQFMQEYARKFGRTDEEIHQYFVREQEELAGLFARSAMAKLCLSNENGWEEVVEQAYGFWMGEGGAGR